MKELNLAEVLAAKRREKGVTQDELAVYVGVSKASVSKWETGLSYPDITLLPILASYFDISIDKLMGYAPQLSHDEIKRIYDRLSARFAEAPFEAVVAECETLTKKYYSCHLFLIKMMQLYVNHASLAGSAQRGKELLVTAANLCERVKVSCQDANLISHAEMFQALCYMSLGESERVLEVLGDTVKPRISVATFISQAHQALGNAEKAKEVIQIELYQDLMGAFSGLLACIQANMGDLDTAFAAYTRAIGLSELFNMRRLNPNNVAVLYVMGAHMFQAAGKREETLAALEKYVDVCVHGFFPFEPRGDAFFDRIDAWLNSNKDNMPRSDAVIKESMLNDVLLNPAFDSLHNLPEFTRLIRKLRDFIGGN